MLCLHELINNNIIGKIKKFLNLRRNATSALRGFFALTTLKA